MKTAYIMIGASGSGKSTWIRNNLHDKVVKCSADNWFMGWNGNYKFDPKELDKAHKACLKQFCMALYNGNDAVCDNTNTTALEVAPYIQVAQAFEYTVLPVYLEPPMRECFNRNVHEVPAIVVERFWEQAKNLVNNDWLPYWPDVLTVKREQKEG